MKSTSSSTDHQLQLHATAVAIDGVGVMIRGESGSGKSDLALRLIDRGAMLVSDDYVDITRSDKTLLLSPPASIAGKMEVRALGIVERDYISGVELKLVVNLNSKPDRFPMDNQTTILLGIAVPSCTLSAMENSVTIKVELALRQIMRAKADT